MKRLGIERDDVIVCYDDQGMFSVARAWWMFKYFGVDQVLILNGGLKKWINEGYPTKGGGHESFQMDKGCFDYKVVDESRCILDISKMHQVAK